MFSVRLSLMRRDELVSWLDRYLKILEFKDNSMNGLQVEGAERVSKIGAAVDGVQVTFEKARAEGVDFLLVHHGLWWGAPFPIVGYQKKRLETLFGAGISLYAAHLPLDAHPEVGNNAVLANQLGLVELQPFIVPKYGPVGFVGKFAASKPLSQVKDHLGQLTGMEPLVHAGGKEEVFRVGIISGAAAGNIADAKALGCDLFITGEPGHQYFHEALELGINVIYAGHYDTETFGVKALAQRIQDEFDIPWVFLDHPTGL